MSNLKFRLVRNYDEATEFLEELKNKFKGNGAEMARSYNVDRSIIHHRKKKAELIIKEEGEAKRDSEFIAPDLADPEMPVEELLEKVTSQFIRRSEAHKDRNWIPFKFNSNKPICLAFVGDPHVDDNGCNWVLLKEHIEAFQSTEGMHCIGLGDYTNNWHGYLNSKVSRHQEVTSNQAWKLAEHLIKSVPWLAIIKGNHDMWSKGNSTADALDYISSGMICEDWQARMEIQFPNGSDLRIHAAHDFKGNSIYNPNHGPMRAEKFSGSQADVYVAGDKHNWIMTKYENADTGKIPNVIRARGYKYIDSYSEQLGFQPQQYGATICLVICPDKSGPQRTKTFECPLDAAQYLKYEREMFDRK